MKGNMGNRLPQNVLHFFFFKQTIGIFEIFNAWYHYAVLKPSERASLGYRLKRPNRVCWESHPTFSVLTENAAGKPGPIRAAPELPALPNLRTHSHGSSMKLPTLALRWATSSRGGPLKVTPERGQILLLVQQWVHKAPETISRSGCFNCLISPYRMRRSAHLQKGLKTTHQLRVHHSHYNCPLQSLWTLHLWGKYTINTRKIKYKCILIIWLISPRKSVLKKHFHYESRHLVKMYQVRFSLPHTEQF